MMKQLTVQSKPHEYEKLLNHLIQAKICCNIFTDKDNISRIVKYQTEPINTGEQVYARNILRRHLWAFYQTD